ncbi:hypothetical protein F4680DRAFT_253835 [Xylaria scruposa]|nr:hypothetical protein F4680DRAFT_253835 [Xylaria scruposa]
MSTLNQSIHMQLRFRPIAIAVNTKVNTSATSGESRLGIWTKAWLNRMCKLCSLLVNTDPSSPPLLCASQPLGEYEYGRSLKYQQHGDYGLQLVITSE